MKKTLASSSSKAQPSSSQQIAQGLLDSSPFSMFSLDREFRYTAFNRAHATSMKKMFNTAIQAGDCILEFIDSAESREKFKKHFERVLSGDLIEAAEEFDDEILSKFFLYVQSIPAIDEGGAVLGVHFYSQTRSDELEKTELALRNSEALFRTTFIYATLGIALVRQTGELIRVNPAFCAMLGYSELELTGKKFNDITFEDDKPIGANFIRDALAGLIETIHFEKRYIHKDGSLIWCDVSSTVFRNSRGEFQYLITHIQNISQAKKAQEELLKHQTHLDELVVERSEQLVFSEARYRSLFENISSVIVIFNPADGHLLDANLAACEFFGFSHDELMGCSMPELVKIDFTELHTHADIILKGEKIFMEAEYKKADGEVRNLGVYPGMIDSRQGRVVLAVIHDITLEKLAEVKLKQSEQKWHSLFEILPVGVSIVDNAHHVVETNPALGKILDLSQEAILKGEYEQRRYLRADRTEMTADEFPTVRTAKEKKNIQNVEIGVEKENGELIWTSVSANPLPDGSGVATVTMDITERKKAEEKIAFQASMLEQVHNGVIVIGLDNKIIYWNKYAEELYQWTSEEAMGRDIIELLTADELKETVYENFKNLYQDGHWDGQFNVLRKDGSRILTQITNSYLVDTLGNKVGFIGISVDIRSRKQIEKDLQENEELFRTSFEYATMGVSLVSTTGRFIRVNQVLCKILGYTEEELLKLTFNDLTHVDDKQIGLTAMKQVISGEKKSLTLEKRYIHKEGRIIWVKISFAAVHNSAGELLYFVSHTQDITESKEMEDSLRKKSRAIESSPVSIVITNLAGSIEYVNPSFTELTGYTEEDSIGQNPRILKSGYTTPSEYKWLWDTILAGKVWQGEFRNRKKNGDYYWESASISPIFDENGNITHFVAVKENITGRKRDQQRISEALAFNQTIINSSPIGIITFNASGNCISANQAAAQIVGTEIENLLKQNFNLLDSWKKDGKYTAARQALLTGKPVTIQSHSFSSYGKEIWMTATFAVFTSIGETNLLLMIQDDSERQKAEESLQLTNTKLASLVTDLEERNREADLLRQMSEMLQICNRVDEAYAVIDQYAARIFTNTSGAVFINNLVSRRVEAVSTWGSQLASETTFPLEKCLSMRSGRVYKVNAALPGLKCQHVNPEFSGYYLGLPLITSGETIGLLHIELPVPDEPGVHMQELAQIMADHTSLSISNIRLREKLHEQSIRDPLTGTFNRRYMEETLGREILRARRKNGHIGLIMLDIDHFKKFNDSHGHAAGDLILTRLSSLLQSTVRGDDVVCRLGGEEFLMILPEADLEATVHRAEAIRSAVEALRVEYDQKSLGVITVSVGVSVYPEQGVTIDDILIQADNAMYAAKNNGRNRVEQAM